LKDLVSERSRWKTAREKACQKPARNSKRL